MIIPLRQSTSRVVRVGSFVDATDGVTPETGVTLGSADQAEIMKAGGGSSVDIASNTWTAVTGADGWYDLTLSTTDTNTVGDLLIVVQDASLCLPVLVRCTVLEEAVYDALYASGATGPAQAGDAMDLVTDAVDSNALATSALTDIEDEILDALLSGHTTAGTVGAFLNLLDDIESDTSTLLTNITISAINATVDTALSDIRLDELLFATASDPATDSLFDLIMSAGVNGFGFQRDQHSLEAIGSGMGISPCYDVTAVPASTTIQTTCPVGTALFNEAGAYELVFFDDDSDTVHARPIVSYTQTNGEFTISAAFPVDPEPADDDKVWVRAVPFQERFDIALTGSSETRATNLDDISTILAFGAPPTVGAIADAVWDEATAGHVAGGSFGAAIATILAFGAPPAASAIADAVWDELISGHLGVGSTGEALSTASSGGVSSQTIRDAMKLAPTAGAPAAGSIDQHLDDIEAFGAPPTAASIADAVWDELTAGHAVSGSFGEELTDLTAAVAALTTPPTVGDIADAVWDEALAGHAVGGSSGAALSSILAFGAPPTASAVADAVWDELTAGHAVSGSFGEELTDLTAAVAALVTPPTVGDIADAVWDEALAGHVGAGSVGEKLNGLDTSNLDVATSTLATASALAAAATEQTTVRKIMTNRIHVDPGTGVLTIFDDDDSSTFLSANIWSNVGGSVAYSGAAAIDRRDKLS